MYWVSAGVLLSLLRISQASQSPIVITPSGRWEGHDGPWSAFDFDIGTPAQRVSLHPAFSLSEIWLWNSTSCSGLEPCASTFAADKSSSWRNWNSSMDRNDATLDGSDLYGVDGQSYLIQSNGRVIDGKLPDDCLAPFVGIGYTGIAIHGKDVGSVPILGSKDLTIEGKVAAGLLATEQRPSLGLLGLNDPTGCRSPGLSLLPSFISVMEQETIKKNLTWLWSYTAGRYNGGLRSTNASLIFGGWDTTRFHNNTLMKGNYSHWIDSTHSLKGAPKTKLNVQILGMDLLEDGNSTHILNTTWVSAPQISLDSTRPTSTLPSNFCRVFLEEDLKLQRDNVSGFYLINDATHQRLSLKNLTIRFNITTLREYYFTTKEYFNESSPHSYFDYDTPDYLKNTTTQGWYNATSKDWHRNSSYTESVNFDFAYKKLLLNYTSAPGMPSSFYFPIQCSNISSEWVLGRDFMQRAYLIVTDDEYYLAKATADPMAKPEFVALQTGEKVIRVPLSKERVLSKVLVTVTVIAGVSGAVLMILTALWLTRTRKKKVERRLP